MAQGEGGGGHFASSGGYGGNFGGAGGAAGNVGGAEHGMLGFGGMSPGGYNAGVYAANLAGVGGVPGFGARVAANQQANRRQQIAQIQAQLAKYPNNIALKQRLKALQTPQVGTGVIPQTTTPPEETPEETTGYTGHNFIDSIQPGWMGPHTGGALGGAGYPTKDQGRIAPGGLNSWGGTVGNMSPSGGQPAYGGPNYGGARQFGGPVEPGQQYTVGENGPETLQMGPGGGGQVIPHNPMDRLGSMRPEMMQKLFQMMRQYGGHQGGPGGQPGGPAWGQGPQPTPPTPAPPTMPQQGGGGWQSRMGIEGLSRPTRQPGMGFGLSGLGQPGVMDQLRQRQGNGGRIG